MKIGFATRDFSASYIDPTTGARSLGGAGHYRVGIVSDWLARNGHKTVVGTLVHQRNSRCGILPLVHYDRPPDERQELIDFDLDVLVLQRGMEPGLTTVLEQARARGQLIVNDVDDHFDRLPSSNRAFLTTLPGYRGDGEDVETYRKVLACSDLITVSTPYLANHYRQYAPTVVLRNAIDLERWRPHDQSEPPVLGWVGATSHRSRDLEQIAGILSGYLGDGYAETFWHGGMTHPGMAATALGLEAGQVTEMPMAPIDRYPTLMLGLDVGIVPLSDVPFNHAKSAIKGMEYAAAGIPFVASASREYVWLRSETGIGRLARSGNDWRHHLDLLKDPGERVAEAREQSRAVAQLDIEHRWREWEDVYSNLTPRRRAITRADRRQRVRFGP